MNDMDKIMIKVSEHAGISIEDIKSRRRTKEICEARRMFMYLSCALLGKSLTSIALYINRTVQNVSSQLIDFDQYLRIYKGLKNQVELIKRELIN